MSFCGVLLDKLLQHCQCGRVDQALPNEDATGSNNRLNAEFTKEKIVSFCLLHCQACSGNFLKGPSLGLQPQTSQKLERGHNSGKSANHQGMNTVMMSDETLLMQPHKGLVGVAILSLSEGKNDPDFILVKICHAPPFRTDQGSGSLRFHSMICSNFAPSSNHSDFAPLPNFDLDPVIFRLGIPG